jgi:hypothetical protein
MSAGAICESSSKLFALCIPVIRQEEIAEKHAVLICCAANYRAWLCSGVFLPPDCCVSLTVTHRRSASYPPAVPSAAPNRRRIDMKIWMLAAATASVAVAGLAQAAEPWTLPQLRGSPVNRTPEPTPARIHSTAWRQEAADPAPNRPPAPMPAIAGHNGIGAGGGQAAIGDGVPAQGAVISQTAWNNEHMYTGYVFGPGSCNYTPPCVNHLWDGYCQRPLRCGHHQHGHRLINHQGGCGYSAGCASCGTSYASCNTGCGMSSGCHGCRLHGRHFGGLGGGGSCSTCGDVCNGGCGHGHFGRGQLFAKCSGWFNNLCDACDGGMSCSCSTPVNGNNGEAIPSPTPDNPMPSDMPEDGKSARRTLLNRYVPWSLK